MPNLNLYRSRTPCLGYLVWEILPGGSWLSPYGPMGPGPNFLPHPPPHDTGIFFLGPSLGLSKIFQARSLRQGVLGKVSLAYIESDWLYITTLFDTIFISVNVFRYYFMLFRYYFTLFQHYLTIFRNYFTLADSTCQNHAKKVV